MHKKHTPISFEEIGEYSGTFKKKKEHKNHHALVK